MATDQKTDFRGISKSDAHDAKFPTEISGEYRVHITEDAYARMKKHVDNTVDVELCGVLVGDVCRDSMGFFLKVSGIIEGLNANNYGAQVTFTHQTWDHINAVKDREFPKLRIVGWYHTHPGFGIFLSGMDTFIQENFFNLPYQVAIVIETKKLEEGCFAWVDGKSTPLHRYWVGNREITLATGEAVDFKPASGQAPGAFAPMSGAPVQGTAQPQYVEPPAQGFSTLWFIVLALMFACGLMLGKMFAINDLRESAVANLESEMYSLIEFATLNAGAAKDFADVKEKLTAIDGKIQANDAAGAKKEIHDLNGQIDSLETAYSKKRSTFRSDLTQLMNKKQNLSERVEANVQHQDDLARNIAFLYLMRVDDAVKASGSDDGSKLTPDGQNLVKSLLAKAVSLAPEAKTSIELKFPKLLQTLFPSPQTESATATATSTGTGTATKKDK